MKKATILWGSLAALGLVLVVSGVLAGWVIKPSVLHSKLNLNDEDSEGYEYFIEPPVDILIRFYFMQVGNAANILAGEDVKPLLVETGPYTYREVREKKDICRPELQFINFGQYIDYVFDEENSCDGCTKDDQVTILNMPLFGALAVAVESPTSGAGLVTSLNSKIASAEVLETDAAPFFTVYVDDFLFGGIKSTLVDFLLTNTLTKSRLPPPFKDGVFALFNGKVNTSENESYQVETSLDSWERHTMITKYGKNISSLEDSLANMKTLSTTNEAKWGSWWVNPDADGNTGENCTCNLLKGTDGQQFPPGVDKDERLWIFNTAPCRSVFMDFQEKQKIEGISTYKYGVPLDGVNINKTMNFCACNDLKSCPECSGDVTENCFKRVDGDPETLDISMCNVENCFDGLQDISKCQGAATFLSYPHFYLAPEQEAKFAGLVPDLSKHETFLNVEPNTGMTVKLHSRVQINTPVHGNADMPTPVYPPNAEQTRLDILQELKSVTAFPVLWLDQGADIEDDEEMLDHLKSQMLLLNFSDVFKWVGIGVGAAAVLLGSFQVVRIACWL